MQFLLIANVSPGAPIEMVELLTQPEARRVWDLYAGGVVRAVWYRTDKPGAVLLLEAPGEQEAREAASSLPMVEAGLLDVELIPLTPYDAIGSLFAG
jgi:hypothetical protein